jgi:aminopeptidase
MTEPQGFVPALFSDFCPDVAELGPAAQIAVNSVLRIQPEERVLVISNPSPDVLRISYALYDAIRRVGAKPVLMLQEVKSQSDYTEESIIMAFDSQPDIVLSISANKMGKDRDGIRTQYEWDGKKFDHVFHYQLYGAKTLRSFWSPAITADMFKRTVPIDYELLKRRCAKIKTVLDEAESVRVTSPLGTDIVIGLRGRLAQVDDGDFSQPGRGGNLPAGETFVSPELATAEGLIVFDGSISLGQGDIVIATPIRATVKAGFVTDIRGGEEASRLVECLTKAEEDARAMEAEGVLSEGRGAEYARNARAIGELGIGLNPAARVSGNMLEDEKAFNTCHFAIGHNYDEDSPALIHLDGLVSRPTIVATLPGGKQQITIERDGKLIE